jgi:hypothetical protein
MDSDGGARAISGFLFQVLVGGALRAAGDCPEYGKAGSSELDALVELVRSGQLVHEFADQDLMVRNSVVDPASSVTAGITLVQVKFSALGTANPIGPAELKQIVTALAQATKRIEKAGECVTGYVLITNRAITDTKPKLLTAAEAIHAQLRKIQGAPMSTWYEKLASFARRFGMRDDEIESGRHRLLGLIFESTTRRVPQRIITRDDLLRCLCGDRAAQELTPEHQALAMRQQVGRFDVDARGKPVRRERMANIESTCAGRALVVFAGPGGSGKTAALHDWTAGLASSAGTMKFGPLVAMLTARELPENWLTQIVNDWNPALRPINSTDALERLNIANGGSVPVLHLALDGADEYPVDATSEGHVRRLAKSFADQDQAVLAGSPLRARLIVTCRNAEEFERDWLMLRRSGGAIEGGREPLVVRFDKFSEAELRELLRINFPELERTLLRDKLSENAPMHMYTSTDSSPVMVDRDAPRHRLAELLLDPVMWRSFCLITPETRARLVAGNLDDEQELARHFCDRFFEKARIRTLIPRPIIETGLIAVAASNQHAGRHFRTMDQWQGPAKAASGMGTIEARKLFFEAESGGLIRRESASRWDWRNDAVELHLANLFAP